MTSITPTHPFVIPADAGIHFTELKLSRLEDDLDGCDTY